MKNYFRLVIYSIPAAIAGLLSSTIIIGLAIGLFGLLTSDISLSNFVAGWSVGLFTAMFAVMLGILPALLYGGAIYAFLVWLERANYITAAIAGGVPGLILFAFKPGIGLLFLAFGIPVAWCTHFFAKRSNKLRNWGSDNASKSAPFCGEV